MTVSSAKVRSIEAPPLVRIVVTDGHTANPGDLSWKELERLGELKIYERCGETLLERCLDADVVLTNKERFDAGILAQLPRLRFISVLATGTNSIDLAAAAAQGVRVSNVPNYSTVSVAQHVFALLLELNNQIHRHAEATRDGTWTRSGHFSNPLHTIHELSGKRFGIVGLGHIGRRVASIAQALGMQVLASWRPGRGKLAKAEGGVKRVPLDELFRVADVLSLHCPLTEETRKLVNRERLRTMKPSAILINTGRGALVDELALAEALRAGWIRGAGLDVLEHEPPPLDHPLLAAPNCSITPHLAWASLEARERLIAESVANVRAFLSGSPRNLVTD